MTNKKFGLSLVLALVFASCSKAGNVSSYQPFLSSASNGTVMDAPSSSNSSDITG